MRKTFELSQFDITDAIKEKYGINFASSIIFLVDLHGNPNKSSGQPVSGTISVKTVEGK